jgi:hypothetical protein
MILGDLILVAASLAVVWFAIWSTRRIERQRHELVLADLEIGWLRRALGDGELPALSDTEIVDGLAPWQPHVEGLAPIHPPLDA